MLLLSCPNCGERNVSEFRYGGEYNPRPPNSLVTSHEEWVRYLYSRRNPSGPEEEWWFHQAGCELWFLAQRHRKTNEVIKTFVWDERRAPAE